MDSMRCVLMLNPRYPVEQAALDLIETAPGRGKAVFLRALILLGFSEIKKDKAREQSTAMRDAVRPGLPEQEA